LGGEKPYREFTFERYQISPENRQAYDRAKHFDPAGDNLYLWGPCGVGKTHLACGAARRCFEETLSVRLLPAYQLSRKTRMKEPDQEQTIIDDFNRADVLVLDDLGAGPDTAHSRQILQEILDGRDFHDRVGLIVTSSYSLDALAQKMGHDSIPSRLAGMCHVIQVGGPDGRLTGGLAHEDTLR
jgi:DNA replication protein DnaC